MHSSLLRKTIAANAVVVGLVFALLGYMLWQPSSDGYSLGAWTLVSFAVGCICGAVVAFAITLTESSIKRED
jgi:hypothetical protein